ncbi:hypothetical protein KR018_009790 [Drosophila ironensis]|nr:hypothetical protein KR018_009790 [Drosophila ironensis]
MHGNNFFRMKSYYLICLLLSLSLSQVNGSCSGDCPDTEDVVWALGGGRCHVFRNECYLIKENCVRRPGLTVTSKEECQQQCPQICPFNYEPTFGVYKGQTRYFSNDCQKQMHTCQTGETFL